MSIEAETQATSTTAAPYLGIPTYVGKADHRSEDVIERGREAWSRIKQRTTWTDWKAIGRALEICRTESMRAVHTNKPLGRAYNSEMSLLLKRYGFDDIDPGERSRLNDCMANLDQIEAWLATLPSKDQIKLNNPKTVISKWRAATRDPNKVSAKRLSDKERIAQLETELKRLHELKDDIFNATDTPHNIARTIVEQMRRLSNDKSEKVLQEAKKLIKAQRAPRAVPA